MTASAVQTPAVYERALAIAPDIACHHRLPGSLLPFARIAECEALLRQATVVHARYAPAHAALANVLVRKRSVAEAIASYREAVTIDPDFAEAHLGLAAWLEAVGDDARAHKHYQRAWAQRRLYLAPNSGVSRNVLVLKAPWEAVANTPLDFAVNPARTALHVLYIGADDPLDCVLPQYDFVYGGMSEFESLEASTKRAMRFIEQQHRPLLNHPAQLFKVRRSRLRETLSDIPHCAVPLTVQNTRAQAARSSRFPLLIRPVDTHRGDGLELMRNALELESYLERFTQQDFYVSEFADYRSADGLYRKYRVVVVDGKPFPYHLGISEQWMISYANSATRHNAWMREEEERFLDDPQAVFPHWNETFPAIAERLGMNFFAVDCARSANGGVLVFEAGPNMLVHCHDTDDALAYKFRYVPRIFDALEELFDETARSQKASTIRSNAGLR